MSEPTLTDAQRTRFARNGFLVCHDGVPDDLLTGPREAVAETVPESLDDLDALVEGPADRHYWNDLDDMSSFGPLNEHLSGYAEALVGEGRLAPPSSFTQVALRYPTGASPADTSHPTTARDGNAHLDVVDADGDLQPFTLGVTTYLDDVHPRGGGLTVWPGTHRQVARWVGEHGPGALSQATVEAVLESDTSPFEVTGPAGTAVLWHPLLIHTGGMHLGREARVAAFTRFSRRDIEQTFAETLADPFSGWAGIPGTA